MTDFTSKITALEDEILSLKISARKAAGVLATVSGLTNSAMSQTVSIPLRILSQESESVRARQAVKITATPTSGNTMFATCTPRITTLDDRQIFVTARKGSDNAAVFVIDVWGSHSDFITIDNGGSVTLSITFDITASENCTTSVDYEDYDDE